jgi:hypothetical protein
MAVHMLGSRRYAMNIIEGRKARALTAADLSRIRR